VRWTPQIKFVRYRGTADGRKKGIRIGFRILALIIGGAGLIAGIISFIRSDATGMNKIPLGELFIAGVFLYVGITGKVPLGLSKPIGKKEAKDDL